MTKQELQRQMDAIDWVNKLKDEVGVSDLSYTLGLLGLEAYSIEDGEDCIKIKKRATNYVKSIKMKERLNKQLISIINRG